MCDPLADALEIDRARRREAREEADAVNLVQEALEKAHKVPSVSNETDYHVVEAIEHLEKVKALLERGA